MSSIQASVVFLKESFRKQSTVFHFLTYLGLLDQDLLIQLDNSHADSVTGLKIYYPGQLQASENHFNRYGDSFELLANRISYYHIKLKLEHQLPEDEKADCQDYPDSPDFGSYDECFVHQRAAYYNDRAGCLHIVHARDASDVCVNATQALKAVGAFRMLETNGADLFGRACRQPCTSLKARNVLHSRGLASNVSEVLLHLSPTVTVVRSIVAYDTISYVAEVGGERWSGDERSGNYGISKSA